MSTAPRVTIEQVEAAIREETYTVLPDGRTTICQLTLDNGFTVDGHSACVSKENFNAEIGNKFAREEAVKKVWGYLGFRLSDQLMLEEGSFLQRLHRERGELELRTLRLGQFIESNPLFDALTPADKEDLRSQFTVMRQYLSILNNRIERAESK
ncbi:hypothetical protein PP761_gp39 [Stenotrophomonas phage Paxi]|uniref:Phage protein n=1 Tax=Stenotrophomonas phage Paxi TaxID=2859653 RepID=A0AAE8BJA0_9CAUD|nr:hypothetical protein PP761_gp39 [Stenotrophomonas phage Paxi]QYW01856.1 hypothetical protein CPT_Paxi_090 [Stenotrophomonas phage Paxi]